MRSSTTIDKFIDPGQCRLSCDFELLSHSQVFSGLFIEVTKLFAYLAKRQQYQDGEYLIMQGNPAHQLFLVVKGGLEITMPHRDHEILLQQLGPKGFFGELSLLAPFRCLFDARAIDDTQVLVIDRQAFQKVIGRFPEQKDKLIERMVQLHMERTAEQTSEILDNVLSGGTVAKSMIRDRSC